MCWKKSEIKSVCDDPNDSEITNLPRLQSSMLFLMSMVLRWQAKKRESSSPSHLRICDLLRRNGKPQVVWFSALQNRASHPKGVCQEPARSKARWGKIRSNEYHGLVRLACGSQRLEFVSCLKATVDSVLFLLKCGSDFFVSLFHTPGFGGAKKEIQLNALIIWIIRAIGRQQGKILKLFLTCQMAFFY